MLGRIVRISKDLGLWTVHPYAYSTHAKLISINNWETCHSSSDIEEIK